MSPLRRAMDEYVTVLRKFGYSYTTSEHVLSNFVHFAESARATYINTAVVLRWTKQANHARSSTWAARVGIVRRFARWMTAIDPRTEVPPDKLFPNRVWRYRPYILTAGEIWRILVAARGLPGFRGHGYSTFFALISVTGMRVSEAAALSCADVDLEAGLLTVKKAKFGKSRLVPLHPTATRALAAFSAKRERIVRCRDTDPFFTYATGLCITDYNARHNWRLACIAAGVRKPAEVARKGRGPRIHDLRHTFAARTLLDWYRRGLDVEREMPKLATYLGHASPTETYYYLEALPELLSLAAQRFTRNGEVHR